MSTAQVFPKIDKMTNILAWIIIGLAGALVAGFSILLGCIIAAILLSVVVSAGVAIVAVLVSMSLLKIGISAAESYLRVRAAQAAYKAAQAMQ